MKTLKEKFINFLLTCISEGYIRKHMKYLDEAKKEHDFNMENNTHTVIGVEGDNYKNWIE